MMTDNPFDKVVAEDSAEIYKQLTQGKVILKQRYNDLQHQLEENPLYTLLFNHSTHFLSLYQHIGYQLVFNHEGSFYYLKELHDQSIDEADKNAFKIQVALLLIGKHFSATGRNLNLLYQQDAGLNEMDLESLKQDHEFGEILKAAQFSKGWDDALDFLTKRNFMFQTSLTSWFVSDAGKAFLEHLVNAYENNE